MVADITIKIKPKINMQRILDLASSDHLELTIAQIINEINYEIMDRLDQYLELITDAIERGRWKGRFLEQIAENVLYHARTIATYGYEHGGAMFGWEADSRSEITKTLYRIRRAYKGHGYDPEDPGLTTGQNVLINSLHPGGQFNIFEIHPQSDEAVVGTKFFWASKLEHGGPKDDSHLGFSEGGEPHEWLIQGLMKLDSSDEHYIDEGYPKEERRRMAMIKAMEIFSNLMMSAKYIPARPFLKPALWTVQRDGSIINTAAFELAETLRTKTERIPGYMARGDEIEVTTTAYDPDQI
jgi:hypothetical protein